MAFVQLFKSFCEPHDMNEGCKKCHHIINVHGRQCLRRISWFNLTTMRKGTLSPPFIDQGIEIQQSLSYYINPSGSWLRDYPCAGWVNPFLSCLRSTGTHRGTISGCTETGIRLDGYAQVQWVWTAHSKVMMWEGFVWEALKNSNTEPCARRLKDGFQDVHGPDTLDIESSVGKQIRHRKRTQ